MSTERSAQRARKTAMLCTALGMGAMLLAPLARPASAAPSAGVLGRSSVDGSTWVEADNARALVYAPRQAAPSPRPVTVILHGLCGEPRSVCAPFVGASTAHGWLVCPKAEDPCGGGSRWRLRGDDDVKLVEASVSELARARAGEVDPAAPRIVVGFSLGGILAVRMAESPQAPGRYGGLVVIASQVHPDAEMLKRAGMKRVVLAAGDYDITSKPLQESARAMNRAGLPTRFVSLGAFGHGFPADMEGRMREPMEWVAGDAGGVTSPSSSP